MLNNLITDLINNKNDFVSEAKEHIKKFIVLTTALGSLVIVVEKIPQLSFSLFLKL